MARKLLVAVVLVAMAMGAVANQCGECTGKTSGPCRHDLDWSCHGYHAGLSPDTCPPGTTPCNAIDCVVSEWSDFGKCTAECGGGTKYRARKVLVFPQHGGEECPTLFDYADCNEQSCNPNQCVVSEWADWGSCSASCDGGVQTRTRVVTGGTENCPDLSETRDCNTHSCNECAGCSHGTSGACKHDADGTCFDYFPGTTQCPAGTTACVISGSSFATQGGAPGDGMCTGCFGKSAGPCRHAKANVCHAFFEGTTECPPGTSQCKPVNCEVSEWSAWDKCSANCGGGSQSRTRTVTVPAANGGASCPHLEESQACNTHACVPHCNSCVGKSSGPCQHDKDNTCFNYMEGTGGQCPPGTHECVEVDCVVSQWSAWGSCSAGCDGGVQFRTRTIKVHPSAGGQQCPHLQENQDCNTHACQWCAGCLGKSSGPCMQDNNNVCHAFYEGTETCPPGTTKCAGVKKASFGELNVVPGDGMCDNCFGKSAGPCRHNKDSSCHDFSWGTTTCPPGTTPCAPVNCEVSEWTAWDKCSASCGGGVQGRSRSITVHPANGGAACPHLEESQTCNTHKCIPICNECTLGTSGPCQHDKDNTCVGYFPKDGLMACPAGTTECRVVDCEVSEWAAWGKCSANCGGGSQSRSRSILTHPSPGGIQCPHLDESQDCNTQACPSCVGCAGKSSGNCMQTNNFVCHNYYEGTTTCPAGTTECTNTLGNTFASLGDAAGNAGDGMCTNCFGKSAGPCRHEKDTSCYEYMAGTTTCPPGTAPCAPVNCEVSSWSAWGKCSVTCGGGNQVRSRSVTVEPRNGGMACPHLEESQDCNTHKCPVICENCGGKSAGPCRHDKDGTCHEFYAGTTECPSGTTECVNIDCEVSEWGAWGKCSAKCGGGSQTRNRVVLVHPSKFGQQCPHLEESQDCNTHKCENCAGCAGKSSGPCMQNNNNVCYNYYAGTTTCPAGTTKCTTNTLGSLNVNPGDGMCTGCFGKSAGPCRHIKDDSCFDYFYGTKTCPPGTVPCAPVNCEVSGWTSWGKCSATCGGGSQSRTRSITVAPANGGAACPSLEESQDCNTHKCPVACTACNGKSAGPCRHDKDLTCHEFYAGTTTCPAGTTVCQDVDCVVSQWGAWTKCSAKCGGGIQSRSRSVVTPQAGAGAACPALTESQDCNTHKCEECSGCVGGTSGPCQHDKDLTCFGYFEGTKSCPPGSTACSVKKTSLGLLGGAPGNGMCDNCFGKSAGPCRHVKDSSCYDFMWGTTTCPPGTAPCAPVNCEVSEWSAFDKCSVSCGGGTQTRSRTITVQPANGGMACPDLEETVVCNDHDCPIECTTCGGKSTGPCQHDKDDTCFDYYTKGGITGCPAGTHECIPVDCEVSAWSKWGKCSATCGGGSQSRTRSITVAPINGGAACPHLDESQDCNTHPCNSCVGCAGKSSGACMQDNNYVCHDFYDGTENCPAGTTKCVKTFGSLGGAAGAPGDGMCTNCFGKSAGPCRHDKDTSCYEYMPGTTTCPPGTSPCAPVNCEVGEWTAWDKCSVECGGGSQSRSRPVLVSPSNGGMACPHLEETQDCNTQACLPICNACAGKSSGNCQHDKDNTCWGYLKDTGACPPGTHECAVPIDCVVSEWGAWGTCSAKCGGGSQSRTRTVLVAAANGGQACPALSETQDCNEQACEMCAGCAGKSAGPCMQDNNNVCYDYYAGTKICPAGTTACVVHSKSFGEVAVLGSTPGDGMCDGCFGKSAGPCRHNKDDSCYAYFPGTTTCPPGTTPCAPVNCEVSEWTAWAKCSVECGGGSQSRSRSVTVAPANGGLACPHLEESQDCNTHKCPVMCDNCAGKSSGPCKSTKGDTCYDYYSKGGITGCPAGTVECVPIDCEVSEWGAWGKCSTNCGGGFRNRERTVTVQPANGGAECPHLTEAESCNTQPCNNCGNCPGKSEGPCVHNANGVCHGYYAGTTICPAGTTECKVSKTTLGQLGGAPGNGMCEGCFGKSSGPCRSNANSACYDYLPFSTTCPPGTSPCKPTNCEVSSWTAWTKCSATCGGGVQSRSRKVTVPATNGGTKCPSLWEEQACNTHKCGATNDDVKAGKCGICDGKTSGPCRHDASDVCHEYYHGTTICPSGTHPCVLCDNCVGKTSGPCQHDKDGSCSAYQIGTTCAPGTHACHAGGSTAADSKTGKGMCTTCWGETSGPCQQANTVCHDYFPGTTTCPGGTQECATAGSVKALDFVVFDMHFDGEVDAETLAQSIADAAEVDVDLVNVDVLESDGQGGMNAGVVVGTNNPAATTALVAGALESSSVGTAFTGFNKPVESSVATSAVAAPSNAAGMSTLVIALVVAGVCAAVALIVGAVVLHRRAANGHGMAMLRTSSSKVMAIHIPTPKNSRVIPKQSPVSSDEETGSSSDEE